MAEIEFLRAELLTGLTFSKIAGEATRKDKRERNRLNARKAYDSILRFMLKADIVSEELNDIRSMLALLRSELRLLVHGARNSLRIVLSYGSCR